MGSPNNRFDPATVSESYLAAVIEARRPMGLFLARATAKSQPGACWVAVDNSTGDAWTEEFGSESAARAWLVGTVKSTSEKQAIALIEAARERLRSRGNAGNRNPKGGEK